MNKQNRHLLLGLAVGAFMALTVPAQASFVSGAINESGDATVTPTSLTFCNSGTEVSGTCPGGAGTTSWVVPASATGSFCNSVSASCTSPTGVFNYQLDSVTMTTLTTVNAPVGVLLAGNGITFVTFNATAGLPSPAIQLNLTELFSGVGAGLTPAQANANCSTGLGQCTPTGSSITFENTAGGGSSATISASGVAISENGQVDPLSITLTAQFTNTEQFELGLFALWQRSQRVTQALLRQLQSPNR